MSMPLIATHAESQPQGEEVQFDQTTALRLAAETAGEFGAFDAAVKFRQQLLAASPGDEENRIELIRLLAASGKKDEALQSLTATIADRDASRTLRSQAIWLVPEIAGIDPSTRIEDDALEQVVAVYLKQNQPRAALKVAEKIAAFQPNNNPESGGQPAPGRYQTLRERARSRQLATHINLLSLLSAAAEQIGDLNRAVEFERLRLALDKNATQARLDHLQELQRAYTRKMLFVVDQKLTADYTD
jgi:tetratricopeptide (TPR) repeat protein